MNENFPKITELRKQNHMYAQQLELCTQQAEERENLYLEIRRNCHDLRKHLSGLLGMIQTRQIKEAEKYILQLLDDGIGEQPKEISHSGNIIVDSLINHVHALAQKDNIQFNVNIFIPASLPFESRHLAIILGNLIENALEACRDVPDNKGIIYLNISYLKGMLQLTIKNNYQSKRKKDVLGRYLTTKNNTTYHGLGLLSINHAVANYQGQVDIIDSNNEFQVTVVMYAPYSESNR